VNATTGLPSYDQLPVGPDAPAGSSWGLWGPEDRLGCLNLLTPERVVGAAALIRKGASFSLDWDLALPDPPLFGRPSIEHTVSGRPGVGHDDSLDRFNPQSSSQWDGFRHIGDGQTHYNGLASEAHGVEHWAQRGIVGRGVLVDVGRWRQRGGTPLDMTVSDPVRPAELAAIAESEGISIEPGDILVLRFGWIEWYLGLDVQTRAKLARLRAPRCPGLAAGPEMVRTLWDLHVAAVASDTPTMEVSPFSAGLSEEEANGPFATLHHVLLPRLGIPIGELWDVRALAEDCAADGVYEFFLTSAPIHVRGGVATPPNALAVK
jgi:hypothetical protein